MATLHRPSERRPERPGLRWLHFSDFHAGGPGAALQHELIDELEAEIVAMASLIGPPDVILFTGDLAYRGIPQEYDQVDQFLTRVYDWLAAVHSEAAAPLLFAIPGNHDLARPSGRYARECHVLRSYEDNAGVIRELRDELWKQRDASLIAPMFKAFTAWQRERVLGPLEAAIQRGSPVKAVHASFFPGDLSVVIERNGTSLALVGLNSSWLQYADGDFSGRLHIPLEQFQAALPTMRERPGTVPSDFLRSASDAFLLMHHPPNWLSPTGRDIFNRSIYKPERFALCMFGHMHDARSETFSLSGGQPRRFFQAPSLFGLENYGTSNESRIFGYAWGELRADRSLRLWPRRAVPKATAPAASTAIPTFNISPAKNGSSCASH